MKQILAVLIVFAGLGCRHSKTGPPATFSGQITTVAGNGTSGTVAVGELATQCPFFSGGAVDFDGHIYLFGIGQIFMVNSAGIIQNFAGTGTPGNSGDGGPASKAEIDLVTCAFDEHGNIYMESGLYVRKINNAGIISTIAGTGTQGYSGDGGAATLAALELASSCATDGAGNIYISFNLKNYIRRISASGFITTVAGSAMAGYSGDGGPATAATLNRPTSLCVDGAGCVYFVDNAQFIRKIDTMGFISTVGGCANPPSPFSGDGGPATLAGIGLNGCCGTGGIGVSRSGEIFVSDAGNQRIRKITKAGIISTIAGNGYEKYDSYGMGTYRGGFSGDGGPATAAELNWPNGVDVTNIGDIFLYDGYNFRLRKVQH